MNNPRRKDIRRAMELLQEAMDIISCAGEEEREAYDNLPESLQYTERGETLEENADTLDEAVDSIYDLMDSLEEIL